jgi:hypothetical protein
MARKPTEADKLAKELELQLAALNAQPSPVDVVRNITNQPATTTKATTYEEARANVSQIKDPKIRAQFEKVFAGVDVQTEKLQTQAGALGYTVNPNTGALQPVSTVTQPNAQVTPIVSTLTPTATGPVLARDFFINTLALLMGSRDEASKPYVSELYRLVSGFYKDGASIQDSINLALYKAQEEKTIPEFTNRFSGIFALQERRLKGEAIDVPTIAEYIKSQQRLGDILRQSALGDLANETFLNTVMATGKSVDESVEIITDVFDLIDNAPAPVKQQISKTFPTVTRAQLAQALLTGTEGVKQLERTVKKAGVIAAGGMQGINVSDTLASDLVSKGQTFQTAGSQFAKVAQILPEAQRLTSFETGITPTEAYTTEQAVSATFDQNAIELQRLADLAEREGARFARRPGTAGSRSFASQTRGMV